MHYFIAKYYRCDAELIILRNRKHPRKLERIINLGLPFPACRIKNIRIYKHAKNIMLAPMPFSIATIFLMLVFGTASIKAINHWDVWLLYCLDFAIIGSFIASLSDIREITRLNKIRKNIRMWFERNEL